MTPVKKLTSYLKNAPEGGLAQFFLTDNEVKIRIGIWKNIKSKPKSTVILLPGATEFMEKYFEVIHELINKGFAVAIIDWQGQGLSDRLLPNPQKHHIDRFESYLSDLEEFVDILKEKGMPGTFNFLAHSMGGHIGLRYLHDNPGVISRAIFSAPMVAIRYGFLPEGIAKLLIKRSIRKGLKDQYALGQGDYGPRRKGKAAMRLLTHDPDRFMDQHLAIDNNPNLALGGQTYGWLGAAISSIKILNSIGYPEKIKTPILIVQAGQDFVVNNKLQKKFAMRLPHVRFENISDSAHEIFKEVDRVRSRFWAYFDDFIEESQL
ncbi:MAG: alpha/beta fold hydrolase [Sphingomonadales bacterium]|jgi:lysophospholipase